MSGYLRPSWHPYRAADPDNPGPCSVGYCGQMAGHLSHYPAPGDDVRVIAGPLTGRRTIVEWIDAWTARTDRGWFDVSELAPIAPAIGDR